MRNTFARIVVWVVVVSAAICALPALIGSFWTPSCSGCHGEHLSLLEASPHKDQDCRSCHEAPGVAGRLGLNYRVMYGMVLRTLPARDGLFSVPNVSCNACHSEAIGSGTISNEGLRIDHKTCAKNRLCVSCHGGIGHAVSTAWESRYAMDDCISCHVRNTSLTEDACETCHDGRMKRSRSSSSTFAIVHGPNWEQSHGMADWNTCSPCHSSARCGSCHGELVPHDRFIIGQHGHAALKSDNKCDTCHRDPAFCHDCHGVEIPHPDAFLKTHKEETQRHGEDACLKCHLKLDCNNCHVGHVHPGGPKLWMD